MSYIQIGLTADPEYLKEKIRQRVKQRGLDKSFEAKEIAIMKNQLVWFKSSPTRPGLIFLPQAGAHQLSNLLKTGIIPDSMPKRSKYPTAPSFLRYSFCCCCGSFFRSARLSSCFCLYHPYVRFQSRC